MIYPRSDICSVTISEAMGGCGQPHVREEGETLWGVSCPQCSDHLRADPLWRVHPEELPECPDEAARRTAMEKNAGARQMAAMDAAAGMLALAYGPRELLAGAGQLAAAPAGPPCRKCSAGVLPGARFCGTCGTPVLREVGSAAS